MKRLQASTLAACLLAAAAGPAAAQYYDRDYYDRDRYSRYDSYDRYDRYDRYGDRPQYDYARVLSVDPLIDSVARPIRRDECWREPVLVRDPVRYGRDRDRTPALVGAIVGGVIGNQFGSGHGRDAATLAGAALGYSAVRDAQRYDHRGRYYSHDRVYRTYAERCAVRTDWRRDDRVVAYEVTYDYNGQVYRTRTNYHPGDTIRVRVDVDPLP